MGIFKAYDIRGLVPEELTPERARAVGRGVAAFLDRGRLAVAQDARPHSPGLCEALVQGMTEAGASVVDLGLLATPMLYYGVEALGLDGGVMVTASHNPGQYNGFKVCGPHAIPIGEATGLRDIERLSEETGPAEKSGSRGSEQVVAGYVEHALAVGSCHRPLRVAIDCGNGMAAVGLEPVLEHLPLEASRLYFEPDCTFPNHPADPLNEENLRDLQAEVLRTEADFGVAFDGDADRAIFVDERGDVVSSDLMTGLLAPSQLARAPGGKVLYDLRSSWATAEAIEAAGGVAEMCRVGHSFVKAQMRETGAVFAGELSGHFYFRFSENLVADDGIAAFVALLDVLSSEEVPLSQRIAPLRRYAASGEISRRIPDPPAFIAEVAGEHEGAPEVSHLDGLLVRYDDWWFNLRPSNTEPLVRLNLEARDPETMTRERDRLLARMDAAAAGGGGS